MTSFQNNQVQVLPALKEQICDLLARGMQDTQVANLCSVSPSYISQLQSTDSLFIAELASRKLRYEQENLDARKRSADLYKQHQELERTLLTSLQQRSSAGLMKPIEQIKLLSIVAAKKAPTEITQPAPQNQINNYVQINLPQAVASQFTLSAKKEIIGMETQNQDGSKQVVSFAPMSTKALKELAAAQPKEEKPAERASMEVIQARVCELTTPKQEATPLEDSNKLLGLFSPELAINI